MRSRSSGWSVGQVAEDDIAGMAPRAIIFALTNPDPEVRSFVAPGPFRRFVVRQAFNSWETRWGETSSTTAMSAPDRPDSARSFAAARESAATSRCRSPNSWTALRCGYLLAQCVVDLGADLNVDRGLVADAFNEADVLASRASPYRGGRGGPASSQARTPMAVHSWLTSQHSRSRPRPRHREPGSWSAAGEQRRRWPTS